MIPLKCIYICRARNSRDRIVVSTPRCGRGKPGSNPGHGNIQCCHGRELSFLDVLHYYGKNAFCEMYLYLSSSQ
jgi:hypothetical protein